MNDEAMRIYCVILAILYWVGFWFGYRKGVKSQRVLAVRNELAKWEPDEKGRTTFYWCNGLPERLKAAEYSRDYNCRVLDVTIKERDLLKSLVKKRMKPEVPNE